ncbi:MAG: hypothetical protein R3283_11100 [Balneolaceae bacterium]|nr:hypothetical protein [Balneolaceae bacterium]
MVSKKPPQVKGQNIPPVEGQQDRNTQEEPNASWLAASRTGVSGKAIYEYSDWSDLTGSQQDREQGINPDVIASLCHSAIHLRNSA